MRVKTRTACAAMTGTQACLPIGAQTARRAGISLTTIESRNNTTVRARFFRPNWSHLLLDAKRTSGGPAHIAATYSDNARAQGASDGSSAGRRLKTMLHLRTQHGCGPRENPVAMFSTVNTTNTPMNSRVSLSATHTIVVMRRLFSNSEP
jgi:hypothetical protein